MNDKQLQSFFTIVETGSFSQAEKRVFVSRQALKKQIDSLEEEVGIKFFSRGTAGITLTLEGKKFYDEMKQIDIQVRQLIRTCRSMRSESCILRILNPDHPALLLEQAFEEFSHLYPEVHQEVLISGNGTRTANIQTQILSDDIDIAECIYEEIHLNEGISFLKLADLTYYCVMPSTHPYIRKDSISFEDLNGMKIGYRPNGNERLARLIVDRAPMATIIEGSGNEARRMYATCYNGGIFITRAYYSANPGNLYSIPLECDITVQCGIIYKTNHKKIVDDFLSVAKALYID